MKMLILCAMLLNGCAAMLQGMGQGMQNQSRQQQASTQCYTHCFAGNCSTQCN